MTAARLQLALIASAAETHVLVTAKKVSAASPYVICALGEMMA